MKPLEHLPPRPRPEEPMHVPPKPAPDKQPPSQEPPQEKGDKRPGRDKQVLMEESMNASYFVHGSASFALAVLLAGCATWNDMNRQEKGTAVGATGGAVVGAVVGGPVGAAVGAGVGGYAGHYETEPGGIAAKPNAGPANSASAGSNAVVTGYSPDLVRAAQQSLNDKGYSVGTVDGQLGPATKTALSRFQQAQGLAQTGDLDSQTLAALGVSQYDNRGATAAPSASPPPNSPPR